MKMKYLSLDTGFCRIYFKGSDSRVYALQQEGGADFAFYQCTRDGEPSFPVPGMTAKPDFWKNLPLPNHGDELVLKARKFIAGKVSVPTKQSDDLDLEALQKAFDASSRGPWKGMPRTPMHTELCWVKAEGQIIKNPRGPDYHVEVLGDEDYDTKVADIEFVTMVHNNFPAIMKALRASKEGSA